MNPHPEVSELLNALLAGIRDALADNLVGVYLCGSLALGDFDPDKSDVDALVVTERPVSDVEMRRLAAFMGPCRRATRTPAAITRSIT